MRLLISCCLLSLSFALPSAGFAAPAADGVQALKRFVAETRSARGSFVQTVHAASGRKPQRAQGSFAFSRPGRFRWAIEAPFPQLLVGDGQTLWSFDPELKQVTVQKMGAALGGSPAAILAGEGDLERDFELSDAGQGEGIMWVEARPRNPESGFSLVRLGLVDGRLQRMSLRDSFGQRTELEFQQFEINPNLPESLFRFVPPPGTELVGEAR